jgi:hypothetical protein
VAFADEPEQRLKAFILHTLPRRDMKHVIDERVECVITGCQEVSKLLFSLRKSAQQSSGARHEPHHHHQP